MQTRTKTGRLHQGRQASPSAATVSAGSSNLTALLKATDEQSVPLTRAQAELMIEKTPIPDVMQMIDYVTLINRVYQHYPHSDKQMLRAAVVEYCRFLALKAVASDRNATILSPSVVVDQIWHLHVLDTKRYESECNMICGSMLHHNPDAGADEAQKQIRRDNTRLLYDAVFPPRYQRSFIGSLIWTHDGGGLSVARERDTTTSDAASPARAAHATSAAPATPAPSAAPAPSALAPSQPAADAAPIVQSKKRKPNDKITFYVQMQAHRLYFEDISPATTIVEQVKQCIQEKAGIPVDQQRLIWEGRQLADERTLASYELPRLTTIHLVLRLSGC